MPTALLDGAPAGEAGAGRGGRSRRRAGRWRAGTPPPGSSTVIAAVPGRAAAAQAGEARAARRRVEGQAGEAGVAAGRGDARARRADDAPSGPVRKTIAMRGRRSATAWRQAAAPGCVGVASRSAPSGLRVGKYQSSASGGGQPIIAALTTSVPAQRRPLTQPATRSRERGGRVAVHDERAAVGALAVITRGPLRRSARVARWLRGGSGRAVGAAARARVVAGADRPRRRRGRARASEQDEGGGA